MQNLRHSSAILLPDADWEATDVSAMVIDDITFKPYLDRFNEIAEMLANLETGSDRRDAVEVVNRAIASLNGLKKSDHSAIGETIALFKERARFLEKEETDVPVVERFRTLADDLEQYDIPNEAWPAMRILASQYTSPQEKDDTRRQRVKSRFARSGGRPRDYRRDIAIMIAIELFEIENREIPSPNDKFVEFFQQIFVKLGLSADKDVAGLESRVRRTLRGLRDPGVPV